MSRTMKLEEHCQLRSERLSFMTGAGPVVDDGFVSALRALLASRSQKAEPAWGYPRASEAPAPCAVAIFEVYESRHLEDRARAGSRRRGVERSKERPDRSAASSGPVRPSITSCIKGRRETGSTPSTYALSSAADLSTTGCGTKAWRVFGMPFACAVARTRRANTCVCTATLGTPCSSKASH
jgi:hypothetical protein